MKKNTNKLIGIVGWKTGENSFGVTTPYLRYLQQFGDVLVITPTSKLFDLDLLVLPGGPDLSSHFYSRMPSLYNSNPDLYKEFFFTHNLHNYVEKGTPIFGICLGMQMLNVHFGGSLTQHISFMHPSSTESREELVHALDFAPSFDYFNVNSVKNRKHKKNAEYTVNSLHHQGVCLSETEAGLSPDDSDLSPELNCVAYSKHGGVVEILAHPTLPIAGVQYHPEELYFSDLHQEQCSKFIIETLLKNEPIKNKQALQENLGNRSISA